MCKGVGERTPIGWTSNGGTGACQTSSGGVAYCLSSFPKTSDSEIEPDFVLLAGVKNSLPWFDNQKTTLVHVSFFLAKVVDVLPRDNTKRTKHTTGIALEGAEGLNGTPLKMFVTRTRHLYPYPALGHLISYTASATWT